MSAHREPDVVAEYAKNARMRGLRVIIAGAGISAALPGAVAAHRSAGDRRAPVRAADGGGRARRDPLDRADAPRACRWRASAWTTPATRRSWQRDSVPRLSSCGRRGMTAAAHPPRARSPVDGRGSHGELAPVEIAASEELRSYGAGSGSAATELGRDSRVHVHNRGGQRARARHRPRRRRVRRRAGRVGRRGGALDPLRADLLGRARHGARAAAARRRRSGPARGALAGWRSADGTHARARADAFRRGVRIGVHAEPTTFRPEVAGFAFEAHRNATRLSGRLRPGDGRGRSPALSGTYAATSPDYRGRVPRAPGLEREGHLHAGRRATVTPSS